MAFHIVKRNPAGVPTPVPQGWIRRGAGNAAASAARFLISNITPETWMSALQPLIPFLPEVFGRRYDYQVGRNLSYIPRGDQAISFWQLRQLAENCELLRLGIETVKDQIASCAWQFKPTEDSDIEADDPLIQKLTAFWQSPDKQNNFKTWLRMLLEEMLVTDAVSIYRRKDQIGGLHSYRIIDGATIFPLIDGDGYPPEPPDPCYQQILKGAVKSALTSEELVYRPRNLRVYSVYGYSPTEQVIMSARQDIERMKYQLAYFTEGSTPDTYMVMGAELTPDQILAFEQRFNAYLSGNASERRKIPAVPKDTKLEQLKPAPLKDEFDEWVARKVCYALSLPPTAFVKQMNRAQAESEQERAKSEGQAPRLLWIQDLINEIVYHDFPEAIGKCQFAWRDEKDQDPAVADAIIINDVKAAVLTINEGRDMKGLDPLPDPIADQPMVYTANGYVPLNNFEIQQQNQEANRQASLETSQNVPVEQSGDGNKSANKALGKAVRHKPIPFRQANRYSINHSHAQRMHEGSKTGS
jgi:Phage portal protein